MRLLSCIVLITTAANICFSIEPTEKFSWKNFDYLWDNSTQKQNAIKSGLYNANASVLYDVDEASDGRTFVTLIKKKGVPASLTTVSNKTGPSGPFLKPYPNWSWYNNNYTCNNHTIISVYRISIKCNYLFVLDSGVIESKTVCPPKLLIFDLKTDELTEHITIPHDIATHDDKSIGLLVTPIVDIQNCNLDNATIFIADSYGNGLIKYNKYTGLCRIESDFMKPNNADTTFTVQNQRFHLDNGGILGLTTIDEVLYYAALSGHKIFKMNMHDLRNCSKLNKAKANNLTELAGTLSGQTGPIASVQSVLFFSNIPNASILCVDATKQFNSSDTKLIAQDSKNLQFTSGLKVTKSEEKLLIATNRLESILGKTLNANEINFRISEISMKQIRKETNCFASNNNQSHDNEHKPSLVIYVKYWYSIYIINPFKDLFESFW